MRARRARGAGPLARALLAAAALATLGCIARAQGWAPDAERPLAPPPVSAGNQSGETLELNGVSVRITYGRVSEGRRAAIDAIAAECGERAIVVEDETQAHVLCPAIGDSRGRAALVRGAAGPALVVGLETASPSELARMFPAEGDVSGDDLRLVPRPRGARRVLSARATEAGHRAVGYRVERPSDEVAREMQSSLRAEGWSVTSGEGAGDGAFAMRAHRLHRWVDVVVLDGDAGATSMVTAWETEAPHAP